MKNSCLLAQSAMSSQCVTPFHYLEPIHKMASVHSDDLSHTAELLRWSCDCFKMWEVWEHEAGADHAVKNEDVLMLKHVSYMKSISLCILQNIVIFSESLSIPFFAALFLEFLWVWAGFYLVNGRHKSDFTMWWEYFSC